MTGSATETLSLHFIEMLILIHRNFYRHLAAPVPLNQFATLMTLRIDGEESLTNIGKFLNISKQQMTSIAEKLTAAGLIARQTDKRDRRRVLLSLTPAGHQVIEDQNEIVRQKFLRSVKNLQQEEQERLADAIDLLNRSIEKMAVPADA